MKNQLKKTVILALISAALAFQGAKAQIVVNNGDLIFGAETVNAGVASGTNLEVDLGSITNFTTTAVLNSGNDANFADVSATDLGSALGTGYATANNDYFSVVGTTATSTNVPGYFKYAVFATLAADPGAQSQVTNSAFEANIAGVYTGLKSTGSGFSAAPNSNSEGEEVAATNNLSYSTEEVSPSTFFNFTSGGSASFGSGLTLNLYALNPFSNSGNNPAKTTTGTDVLLGTFSYSSANGLVFNGAQAVPEPSAYVLAFLAAGLFFVLKRRHALNS